MPTALGQLQLATGIELQNNQLSGMGDWRILRFLVGAEHHVQSSAIGAAPEQDLLHPQALI